MNDPVCANTKSSNTPISVSVYTTHDNLRELEDVLQSICAGVLGEPIPNPSGNKEDLSMIAMAVSLQAKTQNCLMHAYRIRELLFA